MDDKEAEHRLRWMLFDSGIMLFCMLGMFASQLLEPLLGFTVFLISELACAVGMVVTIVEMIQLTYSVDKHMLAQMQVPKISPLLLEKAKQFKDDKRGVMWVWAICLLTIVVMSMAWFTLSWPAFMIIDAVLASYSFPPTARLAITLVSNVISWFLIMMVLGLLLWAFVNSQRREETTYGY
jgi:uncharacterized membrane protein